MDKKTQDKVTVIFTDNPPFNQEGKVENKEAKPEADSLYGGNPAVMADTIEQMANVRKLLKNRLKPVKDAAETFVEINATEKVRLQGSKETKAPSLKPYTEAVDVKDRAELSKLISEARKKNKSFKIGRSMKEGYRYTLLVEADAPQQAKPGDAKVGTHIKIITMTGEPSYTGKVGKITEIDDAGQLHGTWGGLAVIPGDDTFEIVTVVDNESGKVLEKKMEGASEEHHHDEEHKDEGEYDEEGDMAKSDLQIMADAALELHGMLADEENLPEWVQAKITLATDYIDTARDYMKAKKDGLEFPEPKEDEETDTETIVELEPLEEARSKDSIKNEIADLKDKISLIRKGTGDASKRGEINKRLKELQTKLNEAAPGSWGKEVITLQEFATALEKLGRDDIDVFPILSGIAAGTHRAFVKHEGKDTTITVLRGDVVEMTLTSKKEEALVESKPGEKEELKYLLSLEEVSPLSKKDMYRLQELIQKYGNSTEENEEEHFWALVFKRIGGFEEVEKYDDFDDIRADFKDIIQETPEDYEYAVMQKVSIIDGVEEIDIIGEFREGELVENIEEALIEPKKGKKESANNDDNQDLYMDDTEELMSLWIADLCDEHNVKTLSKLTKEQLNDEIKEVNGSIRNEMAFQKGGSEFAEKNIEHLEEYLEILKDALNDKNKSSKSKKEEMEIKDTKFFPGEDGDTEAHIFIEDKGIEDFDLVFDEGRGGYVLTWESKEEKKYLNENHEDLIDIWIGELLEKNKVNKLSNLTVKQLKDEIKEVKGSISNEKVFSTEFSGDNVEGLESYLEVLNDALNDALKQEKKPLKEEAKIISSLDEYEPWSGAVSTWDKVVEADKVDQLDFLLSDLYPEGMTMTELNDILWFESDWVLGMLGISGDGEGKKEKPKASEKPELEDEELTDEEDFMSMLNDIDDEEPVMVVLDDEDLEESKHKKEKHGKEEMKESSGSVVQEVQSFLKNMMKR
jgi:hypothetical protein